MTNLLLGGFDKNSQKTSLYFMDYLGTMAEVPFGAHGYGSYFVLSTMDRLHHSDMSQEEAVDMLVSCIEEVQKRLVINLPSFSYYVINENGFSERKMLAVPPGVKQVENEGEHAVTIAAPMEEAPVPA